MTALHDALLESLHGESVERTLRLLIQNIPRFPLDTHLRRQVVMMAVEEGLIGESQPVIERALAIDIARGDLLAAASTIGLASTCGMVADPLWRSLDEAMLVYGFDAEETQDEEPAEPDIEALRPLLSRTGLLHIAVEMAARPAAVEQRSFAVNAPFLDALPFDSLRGFLAQCSLVTVAACGPGLPMWTIWAHASETWLPPGTLVLSPDELSPQSTVLQPTAQAWQSLLALPGASDLWSGAQEQHAAAGALRVSEVAGALTPAGLQRFFTDGAAVRLTKGIHRSWGDTSGGVGIVLWGEVELVDRAVDPPRTIERLKAGDSFGGEPATATDVATLELSTSGPAAWLFLPQAHITDLLRSEPFAESILTEQAERRLSVLAENPA
jgi:hypothetical protein